MKSGNSLVVIKSVVLIVLLLANVAHAWDSGLEIENPKRIDVVIEKVDEKTIMNGLSTELIRAKVELQLLRNGIIPNANPQTQNKSGYLYVNINIHGNAYGCRVGFHRIVNYKVEGKAYETVASVWQKGGIGAFGRDSSYLLSNIADYLAAMSG